jgi:hypothetical protein
VFAAQFQTLIVSTVILSGAGMNAAPATNTMTQILEDIRKKHHLPALAVVVVKDGGICGRAAAGVRKWGRAKITFECFGGRCLRYRHRETVRQYYAKNPNSGSET